MARWVLENDARWTTLLVRTAFGSYKRQFPGVHAAKLKLKCEVGAENSTMELDIMPTVTTKRLAPSALPPRDDRRRRRSRHHSCFPSPARVFVPVSDSPDRPVVTGVVPASEAAATPVVTGVVVPAGDSADTADWPDEVDLFGSGDEGTSSDCPCSACAHALADREHCDKAALPPPAKKARRRLRTFTVPCER